MNRRTVNGPHVQHARLGIGGGPAPVRSAQLARNRNLILLETQRREHALIARRAQDLLQPRDLRRIEKRINLIRRESLSRESRRLGRKGLRRPRFLARRVALRHRALLDRPQWFARHAIQHEQEPELGRLRHDVDRLTVVLHREQLRRGGQIVIPQVMMHRLKMPQPFSGARVQRQQAISEQPRASAIRPVIIVGWRTQREIHDAAFLVDRNFAPRVHAADVLVRVLGPRVIPEFAGQRNGVEQPRQLARPHIVRAQMAGCRSVSFAYRGSQDDQIFENASRRSALSRAWNRLLQIDAAVVAERVDGDPRARVDFLKLIVRAENDAAVAAILTLPIIQSTIRRLAGLDRMRPDFLARGCVERDDRVGFPHDVHDVVDD